MPFAGLISTPERRRWISEVLNIRSINPNERFRAQPSRTHDSVVFEDLFPLSVLRASDPRLVLDFVMNTILYVHRQDKCRLLLMRRLLPHQLLQN